jgi:hypothetical protein
VFPRPGCRFSSARQAKDWVGDPIVDITGLDPEAAARCVSGWLDTGVLIKATYQKDGHKLNCVTLNEVKVAEILGPRFNSLENNEPESFGTDLADILGTKYDTATARVPFIITAAMKCDLRGTPTRGDTQPRLTARMTGDLTQRPVCKSPAGIIDLRTYGGRKTDGHSYVTLTCGHPTLASLGGRLKLPPEACWFASASREELLPRASARAHASVPMTNCSKHCHRPPPSGRHHGKIGRNLGWRGIFAGPAMQARISQGTAV